MGFLFAFEIEKSYKVETLSKYRWFNDEWCFDYATSTIIVLQR